MKQIVECVPNFSEGRRRDVIDQIARSLTGVEGVQLLDLQADIDHNRSVMTVIGEPSAVVEAMFQAIAKAAELIDMDHHRGGHPRIGAADVVPFVPVQGMTMDDCVALARSLGERVAKELGIPVYLYEAAATRPDRQNLADVRRGEYEGLKEAIGQDADRAPDYGPATLENAGATAIGARPPLVAFNVYLDTDRIEPARAIARAVRHSSGGLRFVKAMGLIVDGQAQVSMNLTDYRHTPIHRVVEMIRSEAGRYGLHVTKTEVVGLLPAQALLEAAQFYLQLADFSPDQVLENRLH